MNLNFSKPGSKSRSDLRGLHLNTSASEWQSNRHQQKPNNRIIISFSITNGKNGTNFTKTFWLMRYANFENIGKLRKHRLDWCGVWIVKTSANWENTASKISPFDYSTLALLYPLLVVRRSLFDPHLLNARQNCSWAKDSRHILILNTQAHVTAPLRGYCIHGWPYLNFDHIWTVVQECTALYSMLGRSHPPASCAHSYDQTFHSCEQVTFIAEMIWTALSLALKQHNTNTGKLIWVAEPSVYSTSNLLNWFATC